MIFPAIQLKLKNLTTTGVRGGLYIEARWAKRKKKTLQQNRNPGVSKETEMLIDCFTITATFMSQVNALSVCLYKVTCVMSLLCTVIFTSLCCLYALLNGTACT